MYRLLIVTTDQNTKDMFASMEGWEALGIKPPRLRDSVEAAIACMHDHPIDAIAIEDTPVLAPLLAYLDEHAPATPLFEIGRSAEEQLATVREVASLLTRLHADDSNDEYDLTDRMEKLRAHWLRKVVRGMERTPEDIRRGLRLYRCGERADVPCILGRLVMPADDGFLTERWHYGGQRLEVALRNFFGHEHGHMLFHVAVVSQEEVRVLCYPRDAGEGLSENEAFEYIQETAEQIEKYLGLSMKVLEVRRIPGLVAFAAENDAL